MLRVSFSVTPAICTFAGANPPESSNPKGLLPQNVNRTPPMKLLSRLISAPSPLNELRVGTYIPAQGVKEVELWPWIGVSTPNARRAPKIQNEAMGFAIRFIKSSKVEVETHSGEPKSSVNCAADG